MATPAATRQIAPRWPKSPPASAGLDRWYCDYAATLEEAALLDVVRFPFLDGGEGR
jgi:hypothetical protein